MKRLLLIINVAVLMVFIQCENELSSAKGAHERCMKENDINFDTIGNMTNDPNDQHKIDCYRSCIWKNTGKIADGKLVEDRVLASYKKNLYRTIDTLTTALTNCIAIANNQTDECMVSSALRTCVHENVHIQIYI